MLIPAFMLGAASVTRSRPMRLAIEARRRRDVPAPPLAARRTPNTDAKHIRVMRGCPATIAALTYPLGHRRVLRKGSDWRRPVAPCAESFVLLDGVAALLGAVASWRHGPVSHIAALVPRAYPFGSACCRRFACLSWGGLLAVLPIVPGHARSQGAYAA